MSKLVLTLDGALLGEYPLEKKYVTLGRRASNDIQIDNLAVSGDHARFITVGDETLIEDLESTNGSQINGKKVQKQALRHGDVVAIGKYKLTYHNEAGNAPAATDGFENTILINAADEDELVEEVAIDAAATGDTLRPARVQVLNGPATGKELELTKTLTTLGKTGAQVAVITRRPQGYFITHVEGEQRPAVNGAAIGMQAYPLADHDVIDVAGVKMEFYLAEQ
jgi:pSer/pThr/pTyr-binding forkhead associated (FHA) protein